MSSLLDQAIIDAKALKEAALKNAEASIINKYSAEVRSTLDKLLEAEDPLAGLGDLGVPPETGAPEPMMGAPLEEEEIFEDSDGVTLAATNGLDKNDSRINEEDDSVPLTINLDALRESIDRLENDLRLEEEDKEEELYEFADEEGDDSLEEEYDLEEGFDLGRSAEQLIALINAAFSGANKIANKQQVAAGLISPDPVKREEAIRAALEQADRETLDDLSARLEKGEMSPGGPPTMEEDVDLDGLTDAIMERLMVDTGADLSGWAGMRSEERKYQMEREMAARKTTGLQDEIKAMKKAQEELVFENKNLKTKITQLAGVLEQAKDNLNEVNVSNARLLYTNRVLRNTSLNERQKNKIVEAISKAGSVGEAKTIFESLQSTMESAPVSRPKSLSEAISRPSPLIRASRHTEEKPVDQFAERLRKLAGI